GSHAIRLGGITVCMGVSLVKICRADAPRRGGGSGGFAADFRTEEPVSLIDLPVVYRFGRIAASPCILTIRSGMRRKSERYYGRPETPASSTRENVLSSLY